MCIRIRDINRANHQYTYIFRALEEEAVRRRNISLERSSQGKILPASSYYIVYLLQLGILLSMLWRMLKKQLLLMKVRSRKMNKLGLSWAKLSTKLASYARKCHLLPLWVTFFKILFHRGVLPLRSSSLEVVFH